MNKISVFIYVSIDGFFAGSHGEIDWFKEIGHDEEFDSYTHKNAKSGSTLLFGRTTYEMMKSYWPTPQAMSSDPGMAAVMNDSRKIVFSRTLKSVDWKNVELRPTIDRDEIIALKQQSDLTILGSGSVVQQIANLGLIDDYTLVVVPLILGNGKPLFNDVHKTNLALREAKSFRNGIVVLHYAPQRAAAAATSPPSSPAP